MAKNGELSFGMVWANLLIEVAFGDGRGREGVRRVNCETSILSRIFDAARRGEHNQRG
jgi:hypothetical protein